MAWPSIRTFLHIPRELTGKQISIAVVDARFPNHPDIASNSHRSAYIVKLSETHPQPARLVADDGPWNKGLHGLWTAAAAGGSGHLSNGQYAGAAPDADLYLLETGRLHTVEDIESKYTAALNWLSLHWRRYNIRGVVLTIAATRDTGLLPWQADPIRIMCERLAHEGMLVVVASGNTKELTCSGPASSPSALSVGGVIMTEDGEVDSSRAEPYHGCRGITFEGKSIPEILAPAENVVLPMPFQSPEERLHHFTAAHDHLPEGYARTEGTSYAGPIVLGCAACIWQAHPDWSANQVKSAMLTSSIKSGRWEELNAGLIHVAAAVHAAPSDDAADNPYSLWQNWKSKDESLRLAAIQDQDDEVVLHAILSFVGERLPREIAVQTSSLLASRSDRVRAAAIVGLAFQAEPITGASLRRFLQDRSHYVRMAALFALNCRPDMWLELAADVISLFSDPDQNIRYCAIKLASTINNGCFVKPLIAGLYDDAIQERVSTFGARCGALEAITGISYEPVPEWREGQCFYSERSTQARLHIARMWAQH